jgi:hypothetical protein
MCNIGTDAATVECEEGPDFIAAVFVWKGGRSPCLGALVVELALVNIKAVHDSVR